MGAQAEAFERAAYAYLDELADEFGRRLIAKLRERTPVDTGNARSRWRLVGRGVVENDAPYIMRLNDGWSQQAPAGFIEQCIDEVMAELQIAAGSITRIQLAGGEVFEYNP